MDPLNASTLGGQLRVAEQRYPPLLRQSAHAHADTSITFVIAGSLWERVRRTEEIARPLSVVVKPRDTTHANEFGDHGVNTLQIIVPERQVLELERWVPSFSTWRWHHAGPSTPAFLRLVEHVRASGTDQTSVMQDAIVDALSALAAGPTPPPRGTAPAWIEAVKEQLEDDGDRASVRSIAAAVGTHPVYLARQFRRWYGCSITEFTRRRRLQRAAFDIGRAAGRLSSISHASGFADHPNMCRLFKRETGVTPSTFQKIASG